MKKSMDILFICSSVMFNLSVGIIYVASRLGNVVLVQVCGGIVIFLIVPFTITLLGYLRKKAEKRIILSHILILSYITVELLLDYILKIQFREILVIHIPYIIVFYAASFSMMSVSFEKNRKMGFVVIATFLVLIMCLIFNLLPL